MTDRKLTVLQINDTHGYLEAHHELVSRSGEPTRNRQDLNVTALDALEQHLGRNFETSPALRGAVVAI